MTTTPLDGRNCCPHEFLARQAELPLVYLPLGLCEPHGHAAAFGLDTIKAEWLCEEAARRSAGSSPRRRAYQIHETGYHRPWLAEVVGEVNPHLGSVPPDVLLRDAALPAPRLHQRRLPRRRGAHRASRQPSRPAARRRRGDATRPVRIIAVSDQELARPDHPAITPAATSCRSSCSSGPTSSTCNPARRHRHQPLGRFAQGTDAGEATADQGRDILEHSLEELGRRIADCQPFEETIEPLSIKATEPIWRRILARQDQWCTLSERDPDQTEAPTPHSPTTRHAPSPCSIEGADMTR